MIGGQIIERDQTRWDRVIKDIREIHYSVTLSGLVHLDWRVGIRGCMLHIAIISMITSILIVNRRVPYVAASKGYDTHHRWLP